VEFATINEAVDALTRVGMSLHGIKRELQRLPSSDDRVECLKRLHPNIRRHFLTKADRRWLARWMK
jgi:hypothetical protein